MLETAKRCAYMFIILKKRNDVQDPVHVHFIAERELIDAVDTALAGKDTNRSQLIRRLLRGSLEIKDREREWTVQPEKLLGSRRDKEAHRPSFAYS